MPSTTKLTAARPCSPNTSLGRALDGELRLLPATFSVYPVSKDGLAIVGDEQAKWGSSAFWHTQCFEASASVEDQSAPWMASCRPHPARMLKAELPGRRVVAMTQGFDLRLLLPDSQLDRLFVALPENCPEHQCNR
jgi:hypothetical protein